MDSSLQLKNMTWQKIQEVTMMLHFMLQIWENQLQDPSAISNMINDGHAIN